MLNPAYLPVKADRFTAYSVTMVFDTDLTNKALRAQVRKSRNDPGAALITLDMVSMPLTTGFRLLSVEDTTDGGKQSRVSMFIERDEIIAAPSTAGLSSDQMAEDDDIVFAWDMTSTDHLGVDEVLAYGPFVLRSGVTRP